MKAALMAKAGAAAGGVFETGDGDVLAKRRGRAGRSRQGRRGAE